MKRREVTKELHDRIMKLIREKDGVVVHVAKAIGWPRQTLCQYIERTPKVKQAVEQAREGMIDEAENVLYEAVRDGKPWAVCFFLKTQGKHRGYVERLENVPPLQVLLDMLPHELKQVVKDALSKAVLDSGNPPSIAGNATKE